MKKRIMWLCLAMVMTVASLSGCNNKETGSSSEIEETTKTETTTKKETDKKAEEKTENKETLENALGKYAFGISPADLKASYGSDDVEEVMPLYNVAQDEAFTFEFDFNYYDEDVELYDFVSVHTDYNCEEDSKIYYNADTEIVDEKKTIVTVSPMSPVLASRQQDSDYVYGGEEEWGNAPMYYLAVHYDMNADKAVKLDEPVIIPFTVRNEVNAPTIKRNVDSQGCLSLSWEPVEGAEKYNIYCLLTDETSCGRNNEAINGAQKGYDGGDSIISLIFDAETTECTFNDFAGEGDGKSVIETTDGIVNLGQNYTVCGEYYVTAVVNGKESGMSNAVTTSDLVLPYKMVDEIHGMEYAEPSDFPLTVEILNIDGSTYDRTVTYTELENGKYSFSVDGTALMGYVRAIDVNSEPPVPEIETNDGGDVTPESDIDMIPDNDIDTIIGSEDNFEEPEVTEPEVTEPEVTEPEVTEPEITEPEDNIVERQRENTEEHISKAIDEKITVEAEGIYINADSAEEEWIALNLIAGNTEFSLEAFPSLQDPNRLVDVFMKTIKQNPYVFGVERYGYSYETFTMKVQYSYEKDELLKKQNELSAKAEEIVEETVTDSMTDEEKADAFYKYLEQNSVYDDDALAAAEASGFLAEDLSDYKDSFEAYGILVNGKGVCASYASSYKLLCDIAGVECVVATGYLDGNLPHAWNIINLDENWYEVDCTNNYNVTGIEYYFYKVDDEIKNMSGYERNADFALDFMLDSYDCEDPAKDYYNKNSLVADDMEEYKKVLTENIKDDTTSLAVRWYGGEVDTEELKQTIKLAYNELGMEDKLGSVMFGVYGGFLLIETA